MTVIATSSKDHPISIHQDGLVGFKWTDSPSWEKQHIDGQQNFVQLPSLWAATYCWQSFSLYQLCCPSVCQRLPKLPYLGFGVGFAISPWIDGWQCLKSSPTFVVIIDQDVWSLPKLGIRNILVSIPLDSWQGIFANAWDYIASRLGCV